MAKKAKNIPRERQASFIPNQLMDTEIAGGEAAQQSSKGGKSGGGMGGQKAGGIKGGGKRKTHVGRKRGV